MGATGLERIAFSPGKTATGYLNGAELDALDADLQSLINRWTSLPDAVKAGIMAMVRTTQ